MGKETATGARKQEENKRLYLSDELIESIQKLGSIYLDYQSKAKAVEKELKEQIDHHMSEHCLWESAESILDIYYCLPMEYPRNYLYDAYWKLIEKRSDTNIDQAGDKNFISCEMLETVKHMGRAYVEHFNEARKVQGKMRHQVAEYLNQHELWNNPDAIHEVINYLPPGYLRFIMYGFYYRAKESLEKESQEGN